MNRRKRRTQNLPVRLTKMDTKTMNNFIGDKDEYDYDCENHSQIRAIIGDGIIENDSKDLVISDDHSTTSDYEGNRTIM